MAKSASILNRGEIITQGGELGGNTGIDSLANTFLNLFLDALSRNYDFEELLAEASITASAGSETVDLSGVTDYRSIREVHLDNDSTPLEQKPYVTLWRKIRVDTANSATGDPEYFAVKPDSSELILWPIPAQAETGKILYYKVPAELSSDSDYPFFDNADVLVAAVADFCATYDRDGMAAIIKRNVDIALGKGLANYDDSGRSDSETLEFDPRYFKSWNGDS